MNISVIIPCHNSAPWICDAIRSVGEQKLLPKQVILVDDSSTDNSVERALSVGIPIDIISVKRKNASTARNDGITVAKGEWVAFLDADDEWLPDHLERASKLLSPPDVAYLATSRYRYADNKSHVFDWGWPAPWPKIPRFGLDRWDFLNWYSAFTSFNHSSLVASLDVLRLIGGYDDNLRRGGHDYELFMRLICQGTWVFDPVPASIVQLNTPSSISSFTVECDYCSLKGLIKNYAAFQSPQMDYLVHHQARSALRSALIYGSAKEIRNTWDISRTVLSPVEKIVYSSLKLFPQISRYLYKIKDGLRNKCS